MLSRFIVQIYTTLIEILLWLLSILGFIVGGLLFSAPLFNPTYGVIGLTVTFIFCSILFGGILLLIDMRLLLISINESLKKV